MADKEVEHIKYDGSPENDSLGDDCDLRGVSWAFALGDHTPCDSAWWVRSTGYTNAYRWYLVLIVEKVRKRGQVLHCASIKSARWRRAPWATCSPVRWNRAVYEGTSFVRVDRNLPTPF